MFLHIFRYRFKKLLRTKEMIFWTLAFPIILATFFNLAFKNLDSSEGFEPAETAVVMSKGYEDNAFFRSVLEEVSTGEDRLLNFTEVTEEEALLLLEEGKITSYMTVDDVISLHVKESGLSQNIMRLFLDNLNQTSAAIKDMTSANPAVIQNLLQAVATPKEYIEEAKRTTAPPNQILNYFYSLIAMSCLYGAFFGSDEVTDIQANISDRAARINLAPVHKMKAFLASSLASYLILMANMGLLLLFLRFVLQIDFGSRVLLLVLTTFVGTLTGMSFGSFISSLVKKGENLKVAIIVTVTMAGSFLAGMMYAQMKYIVMESFPILAYVNPVNLIADSFYSLYYFETLDRFYGNISILLFMSVLFSLGTYLVLRRRRYASI